MSIRYAILGFLGWKAHSGYELKKIFADALSFHWSGNSNQVYGALLDLHKSGAADLTLVEQEGDPRRSSMRSPRLAGKSYATGCSRSQSFHPIGASSTCG